MTTFVTMETICSAVKLNVLLGGGGGEACFTIKPGFDYTANAKTTTQRQNDHKVGQSSFTLIASFLLEIGRCRGRSWLYGNQALVSRQALPTELRPRKSQKPRKVIFRCLLFRVFVYDIEYIRKLRR